MIFLSTANFEKYEKVINNTRIIKLNFRQHNIFKFYHLKLKRIESCTKRIITFTVRLAGGVGHIQEAVKICWKQGATTWGLNIVSATQRVRVRVRVRVHGAWRGCGGASMRDLTYGLKKKSLTISTFSPYCPYFKISTSMSQNILFVKCPRK